VRLLAEKDVDVLVIDTAHGHTAGFIALCGASKLSCRRCR
jgi:hypothetical protein